jgi:enterochelin esterase-like enzyme
MAGLSRRELLISGGTATGLVIAGAVAYELVEGGVLPGKYRLDRALGACGGDPGLPAVTPGPVLTSQFYSQHRRRAVQMVIMRPPGVSGPLPVAVLLHGAGGNAASAVSLGYPQFLASVVSAGVTPFAVVAVDGGGSTYWHRRASGDDPQGMIVYEVLPRLRNLGYQVDSPAVLGWSMGGYGALLLADRLGPVRVSAVCALSPAVFISFADAAAANPEAFDSAADFAANDVRAPWSLATLRQLPVRIDCGESDPFAPADAALRAALGNPAGSIAGGCHDQGFWRRHLAAQLTFAGQHLS